MPSNGLGLDQIVDRWVGDPPRVFDVQRSRVTIDGLAGVTVEYRNVGTARFGSATFLARDSEVITYGFDASGVEQCGGPLLVRDVDLYARIGMSLRIER
jgi:hypothetical protein